MIFHLGPFIQSVSEEGHIQTLHFSVNSNGIIESITPAPHQELIYPAIWFIYDPNPKQLMSCCLVLEAKDKPLLRFNLRQVAETKLFMPAEIPSGENQWTFVRVKGEDFNTRPQKPPYYIVPENCFIPNETQKTLIKTALEAKATLPEQTEIDAVMAKNSLIDAAFNDMKTLSKEKPEAFPLNDSQQALIRSVLYQEWQKLEEETLANLETYYHALSAIVQNKVEDLDIPIDSCRTQAKTLRTYFCESAINTFEGQGHLESGIYRAGRFYLNAKGLSENVSIADVYRFMTATLILAIEKLQKELKKSNEPVSFSPPPHIAENVKIGALPLSEQIQSQLTNAHLSPENEERLQYLQLALSIECDIHLINLEYDVDHNRHKSNQDQFEYQSSLIDPTKLQELIDLVEKIIAGSYSYTPESQLAETIANSLSILFSDAYISNDFNWRVALRDCVLPGLKLKLGLKWLSQPETVEQGKKFLCNYRNVSSWNDYLNNTALNIYGSRNELHTVFSTLLPLSKEEIATYLANVDTETFKKIIFSNYSLSYNNTLVAFFCQPIVSCLSVEKVQILINVVRRINASYLTTNQEIQSWLYLNDSSTSEQREIKSLLKEQTEIEKNCHEVALLLADETVNLQRLWELMPSIESYATIFPILSNEAIAHFFMAVQQVLLAGIDCQTPLGEQKKNTYYQFLANTKTIPYLTTLRDLGQLLSYLNQTNIIRQVLLCLHSHFWTLLDLDSNFTDLLWVCNRKQRGYILTVLTNHILNSNQFHQIQLGSIDFWRLFCSDHSLPEKTSIATRVLEKIFQSSSILESVSSYGAPLPHGIRELRLSKFLRFFSPEVIKKMLIILPKDYSNDIHSCLRIMEFLDFNQKEAFLDSLASPAVPDTFTETIATHLKLMLADAQTKADWQENKPIWLSWSISVMQMHPSLLEHFFSFFQEAQQTAFIHLIPKEQWLTILNSKNIASLLEKSDEKSIHLTVLIHQIGDPIIALLPPLTLQSFLQAMTDEEKFPILDSLSVLFIQQLSTPVSLSPDIGEIKPDSTDNIKSIINGMLQNYVQNASWLTNATKAYDTSSAATFQREIIKQVNILLKWTENEGQHCSASELRQQLILSLQQISWSSAHLNCDNTTLGKMDQSHTAIKSLLYSLKAIEDLQQPSNEKSGENTFIQRQFS